MKIICIGRNYAQHIQELKNATPQEPVIFLKPETALLPAGEKAHIPAFTQDLHYECELVARIGKAGINIPVEKAVEHIDALTLGIDFTARDIQEKLKSKSLPWELAKAFDGSAVVGNFLPANDFQNLNDLRFQLHKNGVLAQDGHTADMLFPVAEILAFVSRYFTLLPGDYIFTGTPAGVGPVQSGDVLTGILNQQEVLHVVMA